MTENPVLPRRVRAILADNENDLFVSAASSWEIATNNRLGKLPQVEPFLDDYEAKIAEAGFTILPITSQQARLAGGFPGKHGDPFDRILAAQAFTESMTLLSNDRKLDLFGALRIW